MIASLPMYDRAELRGAHDRFWQLIRRALGHGPEYLTRDIDPWEIWQSPDLFLSQTCGYPFRAKLHPLVRLVGTPDYALDGCGRGEYRSVFVVRRSDARPDPQDYADGIFAFNDPLSQSGWAAPAQWAEERGFSFANLLWTGAHQASARAIAEGRADLAAIDAQSWRLIERHDAFAQDLRVIAATPPTPGLPLITSPRHDPDVLFNACAAAIDALSPEDKARLGIRGLTRLDAAAYLAVPTPAAPALDATAP